MNRDALEGRLWAEHHIEFGVSMDAFFKSIGHAFRRLAARQYDAPWERVGRAKARTH